MSDSSYPVYLGLWTNWSYGPILGKTLTVTRANGALIIAFAAFFVAATGSQMWRILCFILHSIYSNPKPQDAIYHQRQAILRNSGSPVTGVWEFVLLTWAWRKTSDQSFARLFPVSLYAALIACISIVASGFSSRVALGDEVLIDGRQCGFVSSKNAALVDDYFLRIKPYYAEKTESQADYAQRCYTKDTAEAGCNTLVRKSLPIVINRSAECPFEKSLCLSENANMFLDTGPLDSHRDLGINSPQNLRFQYRQTLHCAPLTTTGYKSNITDTLNRTYTRYMYGEQIVKNAKFNCNCSYAVPTDVLRPTQKLLIEAASTGYKLDTVTAFSSNGSFNPDISSFIPIDEFSKTDADLHLIFLTANTVVFVEKSEDLWYRATSPVKVRASAMQGNGSTVTTTFWEADEPAWPMGCLTQHQFCNPSSPIENHCTKLSGFDDAFASADTLFDPKSGLMEWFSRILDQSGSFSDLISRQGFKSLTSRFSLISKDMQARLKPNQWQMDVMSWFSHRLAALQLQVISTASGPSRANPELKDFVEGPQNREQWRLCRNQKIRSTGYMSFSVFGLLFILIFGFFIILLSFSLAPLAFFIQRKSKLNPYARLEWQATHKLHLQRLAHEGAGFGHWENGSNDIPTTRKGEQLAILDESDLETARFLQSPCEAIMSEHESLTSCEEVDDCARQVVV